MASEVKVFVEVWPRTPSRDDALTGLCTGAWRMYLASLYLETGRCMPAEAKKHGASFGFCDEHGAQQPKATATHVGWTVEPYEPIEVTRGE